MTTVTVLCALLVTDGWNKKVEHSVGTFATAEACLIEANVLKIKLSSKYDQVLIDCTPTIIQK